MSLITVIGRGHSGTRAMSHTLSESGVFMGSELNSSWDKIPPDDMYEACRVIARKVKRTGDLQWDFSETLNGEVDPGFVELIHRYLRDVLDHPGEHKGWKIPETTLCFPWVIRLFPDAKYIFWLRNPYDSIFGAHLTDDLRTFGVEGPDRDDEFFRRAVSWKYQYDLVKATPKPKWWLPVRFEDFVLRQGETLERLEEFLGFPCARVPVNPEAVGRWERAGKPFRFDFLDEAVEECAGL